MNSLSVWQFAGFFGNVHTNKAMGAQQGKERERSAITTGSHHSLTLASAGGGAAGSRQLSKPKSNSLRPTRDPSSSNRSQAFNVFVEHNGKCCKYYNKSWEVFSFISAYGSTYFGVHCP